MKYIALITSVLVVDFITACLVRYLFGRPVNSWYNLFGINAVISDVMSICIGILIGLFISEKLGFTELYQQILICVAVQLLHDVLFYFVIIKPIPSGKNDMIDVFKDYVNKSGIIFGSFDIALFDSVMIILSLLLYKFLETKSDDIVVFIMFCSIYAFTYIQYTRNQYTITPLYEPTK
jgi:hypothetical protein